jgi:hypothetical protein
MEPLADLRLEANETTERYGRQSRPTAPNKTEQIKGLLRLLAEARQSDVSSETLRVFSRSLERYELDDISVAVGALGVQERQQGETAFPALATILSAVKGESIRRKERAAAAAREWQYQDRLRHPDMYISLAEIQADFDKLAKARKAGENIPNPGRCPEIQSLIPAWEARMREFQAAIDAL